MTAVTPAAMALLVAATAAAQEATPLPAPVPTADGSTATLCGQPVPAPAQLPPPGSGPLVYVLGLCFATQGNQSAVEPETYLYYLRLRPSRPSQRDWVLFDDGTRQTIKEDFRRLWATGFLDDLRIEATDYTFPNGVAGKIVTYHLEERSRVRLVKYEGAGDLEQTRIDEALREHGAEIKLDAFLDQGVIRRARTVLRDMLAEKGFAAAEVSSAVAPIEGAGKLVSLTFDVTRGPKLVIRDVAFIGNRAVSDRTLSKVLEDNRPQGLLSLVTRGGTYNETTYADDAQRIEDYYRDHGYVAARVGQPEVRTLDDSADGKARFVQLRIPVDEGRRYRVGTIAFEGQTIVRTEALQSIFKLKPGTWYRQQRLRDGLTKAREIYGSIGHMEFTGYPDLQRRDVPDPDTAGSTPPEGAPAHASTATANAAAGAGPAVVDVVMRLSEGPRYVINRIAFKGNTITRDDVIRRELNLYEGGVFNTEALKHSVRRLNQLGYFKTLEGSDKDLKVDKASGVADAVDLTFTLEEQNRNQIQFGGGVSQYDGAFFNLAYTTTNLLGRGESLTVTGQRGTRSTVYQVGFTEPYAFNRPITAGVEMYSRKVDLITGANTIGYSEVRAGGNLTLGKQLFAYTRAFATYGYEVVDTAIGEALRESLGGDTSRLSSLFLEDGRYIESRITPSFVYNTVDNPYTPRSGRRLSINMPIAGGILGGTTSYVRPEAEAIVYVPHTRRTALGVRLNAGVLRPYGGTRDLPYYLRYVMGGEYQIRGVELRSVGPLDEDARVVGGNKFVLFNAEYYLDVFGPVRALLFHDAGQAFADTERIDLRRLRTSSGVELRVIVPMLNVPFRLIYAWNVHRDSFQPARALKFAVGTTF